MLRKTARWIVITVFVLDLVVLAAIFGGSWSPLRAQASPAPATAEAADGTGDEMPFPDEWTQAAVRELGQRLAQRSQQLDEREQELEELARGVEVLRRTGLLDDENAAPPEAVAEETAPEPQVAVAKPAPAADGPKQQAFARLQKAYENMEPTSAASALEKLAERDRDAVIQLVGGWSPRVSGGILDALTQRNPQLAADLSYEIWKRSERDPAD